MDFGYLPDLTQTLTPRVMRCGNTGVNENHGSVKPVPQCVPVYPEEQS